MKKLPDTLFRMTNEGVDEAIIQYIFDALIEAESRGVRYLNVYNYEADEPVSCSPIMSGKRQINSRAL